MKAPEIFIRIEPQRNADLMKHVAISPSEAADRVAIKEVVEAYAYCADSREAAWLFSERRRYVDWIEQRTLN